MRIDIGPYEDRVNEVGERLDRRINIHLDDYDTWNMDYTLALIIVPMLKQLRDTGHGAPGDIIEFQQTSNQAQDSFPFYGEEDDMAWSAGHQRWLKMLDEMIWAFEQVIEPQDNIFWKPKDKELPLDTVLDEEDILVNPRSFDRDGFEQYNKRIENGLTLFGKYYRGLWD